MPDEAARVKILEIHSEKINVDDGVNLEEVARCCEDFNGAQVKAVCVEAGMIGLRRDKVKLTHQDYVEGVREVKNKNKVNLEYYA